MHELTSYRADCLEKMLFTDDFLSVSQLTGMCSGAHYNLAVDF